MINVYVNEKKEKIKKDANISDFLKSHNIKPGSVAVELNDKLIDKSLYDSFKIKSDDKIRLAYYYVNGNLSGVPAENELPHESGKFGFNRKKTRPEVFANDVLELIGNTPMVKLNRMVEPTMADVLAKIESFNPGGSVKDRICLSMISEAEAKGILNPKSTVIEPTSGNTGIGLAMICAVKGYKCILTMPETMSLERIYIFKSYGAEVILTPGGEGMLGAVRKAEELLKKIPNSFMPQQFKSKANPKVHREFTAREILRVTDSKVDAFVAGVGTGGTITGVGEILKKEIPGVKIVAVEPSSSPVLSGGKPGPHKIQGIGAGFVPEILNKNVIDEIVKVKDDDAFKTAGRLAKEEGIFVGISSGAAVWAALKVAGELGKAKRVVVILPDTGERYFSTEQYYKS